MKTPTLGCLTSVVLLIAARQNSLQAQNYSVDWFKIAGGGGTSTNTQFAVSGTVGQPDVGPAMSAGQFSVTGGFWSLVTAVPSPGAPALAVAHSGHNVIISWPSPSSGFVLQENTSPTNPNGWSNYPGSISDNGTTRSITITSPAGNWLFRLRHP